jgi:hypoxanthine phosphoribosyltransferase
MEMDVIFTREEIAVRVRVLGERITADYDGETLVIIGLLKGGAMFMGDLVREIGLPCEFGFITASSYGAGTESGGDVRILAECDCEIEGRHVIIVDDILDSGRTMSRLKSLLNEQRPASLKICTMLDKPSRRVVDLKADYFGFAIDDVFVVGYGLDYAGRYRNLPYIGVLK